MTEVVSVNLSNSTCDTPASSDNSQSLINSLWAKVGFGIRLSTNGYIKLPNWLGGLMFQWGNVALPGNSPTNVSFSPQFGTSCFCAVATTVGPNDFDRIVYIMSQSQSGLVINNNGSGTSANWFAVGY